MAYDGFVFPAPVLGTRVPVVSDGYHQRDESFHYGVDIGYRRLKDSDPAGLPYASSGGGFYNPPGTPALAAGPGTVVDSSNQAPGGVVKINHGGEILTVYRHLSSRSVSVGQRVSAGDKVGIIGNDIRPGKNKWNHLHFEVLVNGSYIDPQTVMNQWQYVRGPGSLNIAWLTDLFKTPDKTKTDPMRVTFAVGTAALLYLYLS